jgi:ribosomal protein S27AE
MTMTPKEWYDLVAHRTDNDLCVECGTGLFLREHVDNPKRRMILEPLFENNYHGYCKTCWDNQWLFNDQYDETMAAL